MATHADRPRPLPFIAAMALLLAATLIIMAGEWADRAERRAGPEAPVMAYADAIQRGDLAGALQQLAPDLREKSSSFVAWQLGNRYDILESAVQAAAPIDQLFGKGDATRATVVVTMQIEGKGNPTWRTTKEMPVELTDGRWLLTKTPLELPN